MVKLIFLSQNTDDYTYWCDVIIPFEYSSKEDFILEIFEKWDGVKDERFPVIDVAILGGYSLKQEEIDSLEQNILTLEEWFSSKKVTL